MNLFTKQKQTHRHSSKIKLMVTKGKRGQGRDKLGVSDQQLHTALYKIEKEQGPIVQNRELNQYTGVGCHALLQGIFPIQGSNPGLLPCRQILYHQSHQGTQMNHNGKEYEKEYMCICITEPLCSTSETDTTL